MSPLYFVAPIAIVGSVAYSLIARARIQRMAASGQGPRMFHEAYAKHFTSLAADEYIVTLWMGLAYTGSKSGAARVAGAVLNQLAARATGVSTYTPNVYVVLTTYGRVLVAQEHSDFGQRGYYAEVGVWAPGTTAIPGPAALPEHVGPAPLNPFNPMTPLELTALVAADGTRVPFWLSPQGMGIVGQNRPIAALLPAGAGQFAAAWTAARQPGPATA